MKYWPVPDSYSKNIPTIGTSGSFWQNRGDRYHCGVDIYAPVGSDVISVEDGIAIEIGSFTSPDKTPYWNSTYYIVIKNNTGLICKYAELSDVTVKVNDLIEAGQIIGHVGLVLNKDKITKNSPSYIQKIDKNGNYSMLHFELYKSLPILAAKYLGGNWFGDTKPENLLDPTDYLRSTYRKVEGP